MNNICDGINAKTGNFKILHIGSKTTFIPVFFDFLKINMRLSDHKLLARKTQEEWPDDLKSVLTEKEKYSYILSFSKLTHEADKIILHSLCDPRVVLYLFFQPWLLKKCFWIIWGSDLYSYQLGKRDIKWRIVEFFRRPVIKNIGHLVTYIPGDVDLARQWYGATGQYHECLMYPSNLYKEYNVPQKEHTTVNIQVGNSADPSNNHIEVFEKLLAYKEQDIKIFVPLSYGDQIYAKNIIEVGTRLFGDKFLPLTSIMPFEKYLEFLEQIDIAVFNHKRQQGMGNTITLLGLGKKVYMRNDVTPWSMLSDLGIKVFDVQSLDLTQLSEKNKSKNIESIKTNFSEGQLLQQLQNIFTWEADHVILQR